MSSAEYAGTRSVDAASSSRAGLGIDIDIVSDLASVEALWRTFQQNASCTPFQTFEWLSAWQRTIGSATAVEPAVVTLHRHGRIAAIIPLAFQGQSFVRQVTFLGNALCDYNAPLLAPGFDNLLPPRLFLAAWDEIKRRLRKQHRYNLLLLDKQPEWIAGQGNPFLALPTFRNASGAHSMALGTDWDTFYAAKRSSNTRRNDKAKRRKMEAYGAVSFVNAPDATSACRTLETLIAQKTNWFGSRGIPVLFREPGVSRFFQELIDTAPNLVHISEVKIGDACAAANLGLRFKGTYFHILASHGDGPAARFGPGALHLRELIQFAIQGGCHMFDFTIGDEPYKFEWADKKTSLFDHVSGSGITGSLLMTGLATKSAAKRAIKNTPILWTAASQVRQRLFSAQKQPSA